MQFIVKYQTGTYSGKREVHADSEEEAINKVRRYVHANMTLPMYSESYKIVSSFYDEEEETEE
jgi:hypothetical protein